MDRRSILLEGLNKDACVIEIGPSYNPLVPKSEGWNAFTVDHASRDELVAKYRDNPDVDTSQIEIVDFVWNSGSIDDAIPRHLHGSFDAFIASHVIEHTTDIIRFLKSAENLLKPDGVIILAIPDKRKCFDFYRHPSTTVDTIIAYDEQRCRHDKRTQFEHGMRMSNKSGAPGWSITDTSTNVLNTPFEHAKGWLAVSDNEHYIDAHNWIFVPASFELLILELSAMGYINLEIISCLEAEVTEFYSRLRVGSKDNNPVNIQVKRQILMDRIIIELSEQSRQILESPLYKISRPFSMK